MSALRVAPERVRVPLMGHLLGSGRGSRCRLWLTDIPTELRVNYVAACEEVVPLDRIVIGHEAGSAATRRQVRGPVVLRHNQSHRCVDVHQARHTSTYSWRSDAL